MNKINIDKKAFIGIISGFLLWNICFLLIQLILSSIGTCHSTIMIVMSVLLFLTPFISGLVTALIAGKRELLVAPLSIFLAYLPWLIVGNRFIKVQNNPYIPDSILFIALIYILVASFFGGLVALLIKKQKEKKLREETQIEEQKGKKIFISIFLGIIAGYVLFVLGVLILMIPKNWNFKLILVGFIFISSSFTTGFVSGWLAKKKELLIALLTFLIGYIFPAYNQLQGIKEVIVDFRQVAIYVIGQFIQLMLFAILGGFVAKKIRQKQGKDSGD
ncbi:MAG: hypothetical protein P8Z50_05665 [candidate division WOR-3 bacterium]